MFIKQRTTLSNPHLQPVAGLFLSSLSQLCCVTEVLPANRFTHYNLASPFSTALLKVLNLFLLLISMCILLQSSKTIPAASDTVACPLLEKVFPWFSQYLALLALLPPPRLLCFWLLSALLTSCQPFSNIP